MDTTTVASVRIKVAVVCVHVAEGQVRVDAEGALNTYALAELWPR